MGRRIKLRGYTKDLLEKVDKGRKKPWQPRGGLVPPNKTHKPKKGPYKRDRFDWKELLVEDPDDTI